MNNRQRGIFLRLVSAEKAITSEQLAKELGVSSRTIKTDMAALAPELEQNGARLISRRNRGYTLEITDEEKLQKLHNVTQIRAGVSPAADEEGRVIHIARKLVATDRGVLVDVLAEQMYVSRGALRAPLQEALQFCQSFHLRTVSVPGKGLRVTGEEFRIRWAITELFGIHFHQAEIVSGDEEYARWIACDYQERQDIRHVFLKILRESPYAVRDSISQRLSMYLILARNRRRAGLYLDLPTHWIREVRRLPVFQLAQEIYTALARQFEDYGVDTVETCFLAILLLTNLDADLRRDPMEVAPYLAPAAAEVANAMLLAVNTIFGIDLSQLPKAGPLLQATVLPMLARTRYGMDGTRQFNWGSESVYLKLPLETGCARVMAEELERRGCRVGHIDLSVLSCYVMSMLRQAEYPVKPLHLVVTNPIGGEYGALDAAELKDRWPELVESITPMELYALRSLQPEEYDGVLLGHVSDVAGANFTYSFEAPGIRISAMRQGGDFMRVYNQLLVNAYRFEEVLPPGEAFHVWEQFHYYDEEQAIQFLAARYGKDTDSVRRLQRRLGRREKQLTQASGNVMAVLADPALCREPCLDLYRLDKPGKWGESRIQWMVFANFYFKDLPSARAMSVLLSKLTKNPEIFVQNAQDQKAVAVEALKESVRFI